MPHSQIEIRTDDGLCPTHVFTPTGTGPWPAVLFFMDGIGMRPALYPLAERLANAGYFVLMPDLFYRAGAYTAPEPKALFSDPEAGKAWFGKISASASPDMIMRDTRAFLAHLAAEPRVKPGTRGVTGYCMGGRLSIVAAATFPDDIGAAAAYHPGGLATDAPDSPHLLAGKIKARVYVGAAKEDPHFAKDQIDRLEAALTAAHVAHQIEVYDARHGWVPSDTPVHDEAQAEKHWQTLLELLRAQLH